jgi:hypothetical protein
LQRLLARAAAAHPVAAFLHELVRPAAIDMVLAPGLGGGGEEMGEQHPLAGTAETPVAGLPSGDEHRGGEQEKRRLVGRLADRADRLRGGAAEHGLEELDDGDVEAFGRGEVVAAAVGLGFAHRR